MAPMNQVSQTRSSEADPARRANPAVPLLVAEDLFRGAPVILIEFQCVLFDTSFSS